MDRDFRKGRLELPPATERFVSPIRTLARSAVLFAANFGFLASVTLAVFVPGKLLTQFLFYVLDISPDGVLAYFLLDLSDLVLGALAAPAMIYGLVGRMRTGRTPPIAESLRWGRRLWARMLWNRFKVEITVILWSLLIFIPGLVAMVRLSLTEPALAIEADACADPLQRSRDLAGGHGWRIFFVLAPLLLLDTAGSFLVLGELAHQPRWMLALGDAGMAILAGWTTTAVFLMYGGLASPEIRR